MSEARFRLDMLAAHGAPEVVVAFRSGAVKWWEE